MSHSIFYSSIRFRLHLLALACLITFGLTHPASATLITYNESTDGDIPRLATNSGTNFILDTVGTNTITGSQFESTDCRQLPCRTTGFDADAFTMNLVAGLEIVNFTVQYNLTGNVGFPLLEVDSRLFDNGVVSFQLLATRSTQLLPSLATQSVDTIAPPWNASTYLLTNGGFVNESLTLGILNSASWNWSISLDVQAISAASVPEPTTLALLSLGLLGLGYKRKRLT